MEKKPGIETLLEYLMKVESRILHRLERMEKQNTEPAVGAPPATRPATGKETERNRLELIESKLEVITEDLMSLRVRLHEIEERMRCET